MKKRPGDLVRLGSIVRTDDEYKVMNSNLIGIIVRCPLNVKDDEGTVLIGGRLITVDLRNWWRV